MILGRPSRRAVRNHPLAADYDAVEEGGESTLLGRTRLGRTQLAPEAVFPPTVSWARQPPFFRDNNDVWTALELCADADLAAASGL